jgi:uncharacterized membrane protein (DUF4010 family)
MVISELDATVVRNFAIALLIGALVGIEREKSKRARGHATIGGIRTFILFAEAGAVSAWLSQQLASPWPFGLAFVSVAALVTAGYVRTAARDPEELGLTTEAAALAVCLLGGATMLGRAEVAVALAIVTSATLAFKEPIHGAVERLGTDDIYAGLKLLIATFIVLPLLPNHAVDPWGALNPYELWLLVILISGLSLVGYVATRWLGPGRGAAITGLAGGLASSTAVTLAFARRSREEKGIDLLGVGVILAWTMMFLRVIAEVAVVHRPLVASVLVPFAAMGVAGLGAAGVLYRRGAKALASAQPVPLTNPFSLTSASRFAAFFAVVLLVVKGVQEYLPGTGVYAVAALAGLTDVDAITLSMATWTRDGGDPTQAVRAIGIAALSNTATKCVIAVALGAPALRQRLLAVTGAILLAGGAALLYS